MAERTNDSEARITGIVNELMDRMTQSMRSGLTHDEARAAIRHAMNRLATELGPTEPEEEEIRVKEDDDDRG